MAQVPELDEEIIVLDDGGNDEGQECGYGGLRAPARPEPLDDDDLDDRESGTTTMEQVAPHVHGPERDILERRIAIRRARKRGDIFTEKDTEDIRGKKR